MRFVWIFCILCSFQSINSFDFQLVKVEVERLASKIFMGRGILESIIPAFISFLIAPWSDKFGRRPILLCAFFGKQFRYIIWTLDHPFFYFHDFRICRIFFSIPDINNYLNNLNILFNESLVLFDFVYSVIVTWRHMYFDHRHLLLYQRCVK